MEPFDLYGLEVESFDPDALLAAREQTTTRLCHGASTSIEPLHLVDPRTARSASG